MQHQTACDLCHLSYSPSLAPCERRRGASNRSSGGQHGGGDTWPRQRRSVSKDTFGNGHKDAECACGERHGSREEEFKDWVGRGCVPIKPYFKKQAARLWAVVCLLPQVTEPGDGMTQLDTGFWTAGAGRAGEKAT